MHLDEERVRPSTHRSDFAPSLQVWNGKNQMPAFADVLDEDEVKDVAEYVYNTSLANGWIK